MEFKIQSISEITQQAQLFLNYLETQLHNKQTRVIAFYGKMGAGKTTFIKAFCNILGVEDEVNSPTFALINQYFAGKETIFHFDFYRIKSVEEAFDFGYEDYFYSGNYCLVEWPEMIENLLPEDFIKVQIIENEDKTRTLIVE